MSGTISQATYLKYQKQERTIKQLDAQLHNYGIRLLLSLPDHTSILTIMNLDKGKVMSLSAVKLILKNLKKGTLSAFKVRQYIDTSGQPIIKEKKEQK